MAEAVRELGQCSNSSDCLGINEGVRTNSVRVNSENF